MSDTTMLSAMPPPPPRPPRERPLIRPRLFLQQGTISGGGDNNSSVMKSGIFSSCMKGQAPLQPLRKECALPPPSASVTPPPPPTITAPRLKRKDSIDDESEDSSRPSKLTKSDQVLEEPLKAEKDAVNALCNAVGEWKPFVSKVARFIEAEKLPFEYFDIWAPDSSRSDNDDDNPAGSTTGSSSSDLVLRHVGHATNRNTEMSSIFTMYHMNQFGSCSESYAFPPGVGLPGRVLAKGQPMWDDSLQRARYVDFPRSELAKRHGVKKGLGIPLSGHAIMVMYTTQDIPEDVGFVQTTYQEFQKSKLPQHVLTPGSSSTTKSNDQLTRFQKVGAPAKVKNDNDDVAIDYRALLPDTMEVEMARLLTQHVPQRSKALQRLLWRPPYRRTYADNVSLEKLKKRYKAFIKQSSSSKKEVASRVVKEWESVRPSNKIFRW